MSVARHVIGAGISKSVLLGIFLLLLLLPSPTPDPLDVGARFSWPFICAIFAASVFALRLAQHVVGGFRASAVTGPAARQPNAMQRSGSASAAEVDGTAGTASARGVLKGLRPGVAELLLGIYVLIVLATWPFAHDRSVTAVWVLVLLSQIATFYAVRSVFARPMARGLALAGLIIGLSLLQLLAVHDHLAAGLETRPADYLTPAGWSGRPELGFLAAVLVGLLTGIWLESRSWYERAAGAILWVTALIQLAFLFARMGWIAGVVTIAAAGAASIKVGRFRLYAAVVGMTIAIATPAVVRHPLVRPLIQTFAGERVVAGGATPEHRLEIWSRTVHMIRERWATGTGLGNFQAVYEPNYNPEPNEDTRRGVHAHNTWLQQAGELGVAGGLAYALLWVGVLVAGWRRIGRADADGGVVNTAVWLALVGAAVYLSGETLTFDLEGPRIRMQTLCWLLWALALAPAERQVAARHA